MLDRDAFEDLMGAYLGRLRAAVGRANAAFVSLPRASPFLARSLSARRGRPNVLHDLIWASLVEDLGDCGDVEFMDDDGSGDPDPTKREALWFEGRVRMRVKQHQKRSLEIRSYPTVSAQAFMGQGAQLSLDLATGEVVTPTNVALGYTFSEKRGRIDNVLVSARLARRQLAWLLDLGDPAVGGGDPSTTAPLDGAPASGPPAPKAIPRPAASAGTSVDEDEEEAEGS